MERNIGHAYTKACQMHDEQKENGLVDIQADTYGSRQTDTLIDEGKKLSSKQTTDTQ